MPNDPVQIIYPLEDPSFRPQLINALIDWYEQQGWTPFMLVLVDDATNVPREYVNEEGIVVLCVSSEATNNFYFQDNVLHFQARFGGRVRDLAIPAGRITAIYPKEDTDKVSMFSVIDSVATPTQPTEMSKTSDEDDDLPVFTKLT